MNILECIIARSSPIFFVRRICREFRLRNRCPTIDLIQHATSAKEKEIALAAGPTASRIRSLLFLPTGGLSQAYRMVQEMSTTDAAYIHGVIIAPTMTWTMPGTADLRGRRVGR